MSGEKGQHLTIKGVTWPGLLFLLLLLGASVPLFGRGLALGMGVGMAVGLLNFKAIELIVKRVMGPDGGSRLLYGIFGMVKFLVLGGIFFLLIYYKFFDVYGIVAGFTAVLLLVMMEGLLRANRFDTNELTVEE
ncbi:MAG: hypothetical protein GXP58_08910 [Deltaproteobacteria bacterium]|nr:hypothetical protein [Deltaproteobacteria bacterium]